ncbi:hypothetical protein [Algoriphagus vanfongensis]|uniref:hypothetical protein n=1 Tax=Algoriphagus vanfongensis TaxID=426371 RepID=UPI00041FC83A|nr:hypothetical protein [Algoriphagus vanfongensis]
MSKPILHKGFVFLLFLMTSPQEVQKNKASIYYGTPATIAVPETHHRSKVSPVQEEYMPPDTLIQHLGRDNIPISYSKNIRTSVCFDNQCRLLVAKVHWNPTGRYLGYSLPEGEFLSKKEHDPFSVQEYERLNSLLADPNLPLGSISYNELVLESQAPLVGIDGVSGATNQDLLAYIVEGAAYTTYKLYQILYGPDRQFIENWTRETLNEAFVIEALKSPEIADQLWLLKVLKGRLSEFPIARQQIAELTKSPNFSLADNALQAFSERDLEDDQITNLLFDLFEMGDYGKRNRILALLESSKTVNTISIKRLSEHVLQLESPFQVRVIRLFEKHKIKNSAFDQAMKQLSQSNNDFVAQEARSYLKLR